jgi:methionyl-tRNA formyltransferase
MKLVFAGTPEFSVPALDALHAAAHRIVGVYTQPDRPAGRGQKLTSSAVALRAAQLKLPIFKPAKLAGAAVDELRQLAPDIMVVVAYGLILPQAVLDIPRHGCINIHASLLPRWRGAAPIQRAILAGDRETGVTIMRMDAGLDTGPMLLSAKLPIMDSTTAAQLHEALSTLGAKLIVEALAQMAAGTLKATAQPEQGATYARKITKEEARLDWNLPAAELARRVRAYNPLPIAWTELESERIRIYAARALPGRLGGTPGSIVAAGDTGIEVACGEGRLSIQELQWPGGRPMAARDAAAGRKLLALQFH